MEQAAAVYIPCMTHSHFVATVTLVHIVHCLQNALMEACTTQNWLMWFLVFVVANRCELEDQTVTFQHCPLAARDFAVLTGQPVQQHAEGKPVSHNMRLQVGQEAEWQTWHHYCASCKRMQHTCACASLCSSLLALMSYANRFG